MKWKESSLQSRFYLAAAVILVIGLSSASLVYLTTDAATDNPSLDDYAISKKYIHDLELYGGKFNVLQDQFRRWFLNLWSGRRLASTILFLTAVLSAGCALAAYHLPPDGEPGPGE